MNASRRCRFFEAIAIVAFALQAASCATVPPLRDVDPLGALAPYATYYIVLPVAEHRALLRAIAQRADKTGALLDVAARTDIVYASVRSTPTGPDLRAVAGGNFPRTAAPLIFPASKGWLKSDKPAASGKGKAVSWYSSRNLSVSIPASGIALVSAGAGNAAFDLAPANPARTVFPPAFASRAAAARAGIPGTPVSFLVTDPSALFSAILGLDISLPVEYLEVEAATAEGGAGYILSFHAAAPDERTARAMRTLLRIATGTDVTISGRDVFVRRYPVTTEKLADFAGFLYVKM